MANRNKHLVLAVRGGSSRRASNEGIGPVFLLACFLHAMQWECSRARNDESKRLRPGFFACLFSAHG